jgi:hypothetical protein
MYHERDARFSHFRFMNSRSRGLDTDRGPATVRDVASAERLQVPSRDARGWWWCARPPAANGDAASMMMISYLSNVFFSSTSSLTRHDPGCPGREIAREVSCGRMADGQWECGLCGSRTAYVLGASRRARSVKYRRAWLRRMRVELPSGEIEVERSREKPELPRVGHI